jgi:DNA-binding CsgD family transcriptional regulator
MGERSSSVCQPIDTGVPPALLAALEAADRFAAQVPAVIYVLDRNHNLIWLAKDWENLSGLTIEETKSRGIHSAIHPDDAAAITATKRSISHSWSSKSLTPEPLSLTYRILSTNGGVTRVLDRIAASQDDAGEIVGFVGVLVEIGEITPLADPKSDERLEGLSKREGEVANLLSTGLTNRLAAEKMGISVRTVEAHRARLMKKLKIRSIVELVQLPTPRQKPAGRKAVR